MTSTPPHQHQHPHNTAAENTILNYILLFFVCAFIGWLWEVLIFIYMTGGFVNRGVLHGPWLPIYGCGGLIIAILFNRFKKYPPIVFLASAIGCGILEYFTGWYLETFKHLKWWDYTGQFLNLHGRICFTSVLSFGVCGLIIIYFLYPFLTRCLDRLRLRPKKVLCFVLILLFLGDFIYSSDVPNTGEGITNEISNIPAQISIQKITPPK